MKLPRVLPPPLADRAPPDLKPGRSDDAPVEPPKPAKPVKARNGKA